MFIVARDSHYEMGGDIYINIVHMKAKNLIYNEDVDDTFLALHQSLRLFQSPPPTCNQGMQIFSSQMAEYSICVSA